MKWILCASAAIVALAGTSAWSADIGVKAPTPPAPPAPVASWTGCYIGANAGWIGSEDRYALAPSGNYLIPPGFFAPPSATGTGDFPANRAALTHSYSNDGGGALVGGQIGCNLQTGQFVFGFEADEQWTSMKNSFSASYAAFTNVGNPLFTNNAHTEQASSSLEGLATVRGRIGYAWDRWLVYATGGLAVGEIRSQTNVTFATTGNLFAVYDGATHIGSVITTRIGWAVGGGAEYAIASHWSVKAEFLYIDLGTYAYSSPLVTAGVGVVATGYTWSTTVRERDEVARVGLNYRFN